jgi:hypothetical protein
VRKQDLEDFLERNASENMDDSELASFIELSLIDDKEKAEFKKRRISIAGSFTGKWNATVSNERYLDKCFKRWNALIASECARWGLTPPENPVFVEE